MSEHDRIKHLQAIIREDTEEILRLRAENEKLQRRIHLFKNTRNEQVFEKLMKAHEEIEKLRARLEKAHSFISRADWMLFFEEEHAAATALKETGDE